MKKSIVISTTLLLGICALSLTSYAKEDIDPDVLSKSNWEVVSVVDAKGKTVIKQNENLMVRAKYDLKTNHYEFFELEGKKSKEEGTFFLTENTVKNDRVFDGQQQLTDIVELDKTVYTFRTTGKQEDGKQGDVFVVSKPYTEEKLDFTTPVTDIPAGSSTIADKPKGAFILSKDVWKASKVVSADGEDNLTEYNNDLMNYVMFDGKTGRYEHFDMTTKKSTKDYGFFDVIKDNTEFVSINHDAKKHLIAKVKDLNNKDFTYQVDGKNKSGEKVKVDVEFELADIKRDDLIFTITEAEASNRPKMPEQSENPTLPEKPNPGPDTGSSTTSSDVNTGSTTTDSSGNTGGTTSSDSSTDSSTTSSEPSDIEVPKAPSIIQPYAGDKVLRGTAQVHTKIVLKKSVFETKPNSVKAEKKFVDMGIAEVNSDGQWELNLTDALAPGEEIEAVAVNVKRPEFQSKPTYVTVKESGKGKGSNKPGGTNQHNKKPGGTNQNNKKPGGTNQNNKKPDGKKLPQTGEAVKNTSLVIGGVIIVGVIVAIYMKNKKGKEN
ncbi:DUF4822 domain-containing protein [Vagococcus jeotgali]|uniref:DUF4822 domain-containing protein n=1 Tax=Vagococcus jeotgali TaxID=3109030 RepID=UPI002DD7AA98|nr:DUF4822 domain-containing protein [Vagococcus sp. B2T-5]